MTDRLYAKNMWLISTIYDAGKISFEDIARKQEKGKHPSDKVLDRMKTEL